MCSSIFPEVRLVDTFIQRFNQDVDHTLLKSIFIVLAIFNYLVRYTVQYSEPLFVKIHYEQPRSGNSKSVHWKVKVNFNYVNMLKFIGNYFLPYNVTESTSKVIACMNLFITP